MGQAGEKPAPSKGDEIEITEEMAQAALSLLSDFDPTYDDGRTFVESLYRAMVSAQPQTPSEARLVFEPLQQS